ncbi:hypothetical protein HYU17_05855 [Candidatus Woesearchaeota archaeon]|nr:hypothetical protein [Candidatus Woesearchaeota archaeon]
MQVLQFRRCRKGQAAMEFLMTYGWAILAVLVVIGALAYFGLLKPQQALPTKCQLPVGLFCADYALSKTAGQSQFTITNGLGADLQIKDIRITSDTGLFQCTANNVAGAGFQQVILSAGNSYRHVFSGAYDPANGGNGCSADPGLSEGLRIKAKLGITYKNLRTDSMASANGTIIADLAG